MTIRAEKPAYIEKIWRIHAEAFETEEEADLVNVLRDSGISYISLVYEKKHEFVGHIFFTPVEPVDDTPDLRIMGLAPMAVIPTMQNEGIGSLLVKAEIQQCLSEDYDAIVVLGHPTYYPKFGFVPSVNYGIRSEYEVPADVFMVLELQKNVLKGKQGTVRYHEAFGSA